MSSPESAAPQAPKLEENFHVLYHGAMRSNGFLKTPAAAAAVDSGGAAVVIDPWHWINADATAASAADMGSAGQATSTVPALFPRYEEGAGHVPSPSSTPSGAEVIEEC